MEAIFNKDFNAEPLKPDLKSRLQVCCVYGDTTFTVMRDEKTVLGVQRRSRRMIIKEDLTGDRSAASPIAFSLHTNIVNTVLVNEDLNLMLAGDDNERVVQYDLTTGRVQKDYGNLRVGDIVALHCIGPVAFAGGWRTNLFRVLFLDKRKVFGPPFRTSIYYVSSLQLCFVRKNLFLQGSRMLLAVSGYNPAYGPWSTDIFDATRLIKHYQERVNPDCEMVDFSKKEEIDQETKNDFVAGLSKKIEFAYGKIARKKSGLR